jgi:tryptophan synthase beta chain
VAIPPEVRLAYSLWRPTPLRRAHALERHLDTSARIEQPGAFVLGAVEGTVEAFELLGDELVLVGRGAGDEGALSGEECSRSSSA